MIYLLFGIVLWIAMVLAHAIGFARTKPKWNFPTDLDRNRLNIMAWRGFYQVTGIFMARRHHNWLRQWVPLPEFPYMKWGNQTLNGNYYLVRHLIKDLSQQDIMEGDPRDVFGKGVEAFMQKIEKELASNRIVAFAKQPMPGGLDFSVQLHDPVTGCHMRVLRGYDMADNIFLTELSVMMVVKPL